MKRILIYSHDTFGLGNIRRMLEIARHLVQARDDVSVLVITGSPMLHAFRIPAGIDYLKLPCLSRDVDGRYGARSLPLSLGHTVRLRSNLIRAAVEDFAPDLVLVDKKPLGVEDELADALSSMAAAPHPPRLVLLLRDILDSAQATRRVWRKNGYFDAIDAYYDQVLVVGCPEVYDLRREYAFPARTAAKLRFCGYIAREPGRRARDEMRATLGVRGDEPLLLVTPGGGADGQSLVAQALEAVQLLPEAGRPRVHIVCGPEMHEDARARTHAAAAAASGIGVQDFSDDMMSLIGAADLVLAMGGYNTVCELLTHRRRAILVPRVRPGVEQWLRAERMAALGLLRCLHPSRLEAGTLAAAIAEELALLRAGVVPPALERLDGLAGVTAALSGWLDGAPRTGHPGRPSTARGPAPTVAGQAPTPAPERREVAW